MGENSTTHKLSVIVPVFNGARTISQALKSLQAQTLTDWECIVVDDGSTDLSYNIARAFGERDPRIWALRLPSNCGAARAINEGMQRVYGKHTSHAPYIAILAADDYWLDNFAEKTVAALEDNENAVGAYTDYIEWYEIDSIKRVHRCPDFDRERLLRGDFVNFSAFVFRAGEVTYLDPDWNPVADWDALLRMTPALLHVPMILSVRRLHSAQVSAGLGGPRMMFKRLLLPFRYDTFLGATRTALRRLQGAVWHIARAPKL